MVSWIREHPYLSGGVLLALVVLWVIVRRNNSSAATAGSTSTTDASLQALQIQTGAAVNSQQIAANAQVAGYNATLNAAALNDAATVELSRIGADVQTSQIVAAQDVTNNQTGAELALGMVQAGYTPIFSADFGGFHFGGVTPGSIGGGTVPGSGSPGVSGGYGASAGAGAAVATQQNNSIAAGAGAPVMTSIPAGFFNLGGPYGSAAIPSQGFDNIPTQTTGEDYYTYRSAVEHATGFTSQCSPTDEQCIANENGIGLYVDSTYSPNLAGATPVTTVKTNFSPSLSGTCAERAGGPNACVSGA